MRRVTAYHMMEDNPDRSGERQKLEKSLDAAIRTILPGILARSSTEPTQPPSISEQLRKAIEEQQPRQEILARRFMDWVVEQLGAVAPDLSGPGETDELLIEALPKTKSLVIEFARVADMIAQYDAQDAAQAVHEGFGPILESYNRPVG